MQLVKPFLLFLSLFALIISCEEETSNGNEQKFFVARAYDSKTLEAEVLHLGSVDQSTLNELEKAAVQIRQEELAKIRELLRIGANTIMVNLGRCLPQEPRVPPGPCPLLEDLLANVPAGTNIELDLVGAFMDDLNIPHMRVSQIQGSAEVTTLDGKKIFAKGTLNSYDSLFKTAWYHFDMENPALAGKQLLLKLQTVIVVNKQEQTVTLQRIIPPDFFQIK